MYAYYMYAYFICMHKIQKGDGSIFCEMKESFPKRSDKLHVGSNPPELTDTEFVHRTVHSGNGPYTKKVPSTFFSSFLKKSLTVV